MAIELFMRRTIVAAFVVAALAAGKPASAQAPANPQDACMTQIGSCYYWAATQAGFWMMWAGGLNCEFQMIDCIRRAVLGR